MDSDTSIILCIILLCTCKRPAFCHVINDAWDISDFSPNLSICFAWKFLQSTCMHCRTELALVGSIYLLWSSCPTPQEWGSCFRSKAWPLGNFMTSTGLASIFCFIASIMQDLSISAKCTLLLVEVPKAWRHCPMATSALHFPIWNGNGGQRARISGLTWVQVSRLWSSLCTPYLWPYFAFIEVSWRHAWCIIAAISTTEASMTAECWFAELPCGWPFSSASCPWWWCEYRFSGPGWSLFFKWLMHDWL